MVPRTAQTASGAPTAPPNGRRRRLPLRVSAVRNHYHKGRHPNQKAFHGHSDDVNKVYDFLGDIRDRYIFRLLENGYDRLSFVLAVSEDELEEMGFKLGHRKYVMRLIRDFDADEFAALRIARNAERNAKEKTPKAQKTEKREKAKAEKKTEVTTAKWRQKQPTPTPAKTKEKEKEKEKAKAKTESVSVPVVEAVSIPQTLKASQRLHHPNSPISVSSESLDDAEVVSAMANSEHKADVSQSVDHSEYAKMMQLAFYTFAGHQPWAKVSGLYMYKKDLSRFLEILNIEDSADDVFAVLDSEVTDGKVTMTEWMDYFVNAKVNPTVPQIRAHILQQTSWRLLVKSLQIFERVDADHSGKLEYGEFTQFGALIELDASETELLWNTMDENGSGSIDIVELFEWFRARLYAQRQRTNGDADSSESVVSDDENDEDQKAQKAQKSAVTTTQRQFQMKDERNIAEDVNADISHVDDDEKVIG